MGKPDRLRHATAVVGAFLVLALVGCGGGSAIGGGESAAIRRSDRAMLLFVRCMRAHGIDMADPAPRPGHAGLSIDLPERGPATSTAYRACGSILQPLIEAKQAHLKVIPDSERLGLVHYAECMREHSIAMLDPTPDGELNLGNVPGVNTDFGRYSPQFLVADRLCRHLLPVAVHDNGTGP